MTIDEAIKHARKIEEECRYYTKFEKGTMLQNWLACAEEHKQIAEWLEELKDYRDKNKMVIRIDAMNCEEFVDYVEQAYNKAIDDFVKAYKSKTTMEHKLVEEIAEQLKECTRDDGE